MPRCSVCTHPQRDDVNRRLLAVATSGETYATIGAAYGLSSSAIDRHRANHLKLAPGLVSEARNALTIVGYASDLYDRATGLLDRAEAVLIQEDASAKSVQAAAASLREVRQSIELLSRLIVTAPPEAPDDGNSWLDEAIAAAVRPMLALGDGVEEAVVVPDPGVMEPPPSP